MPFRRKDDGIHLHVSANERAILASLADQFITILDGDAAADPALARMFPTAYPDDPEAAAEFDRYTRDDLTTAKQEQSRLVRTTLGERNRAVETLLDADAEQAWVRWLTDIRITLATRIDAADGAASGGTTRDGMTTGSAASSAMGARARRAASAEAHRTVSLLGGVYDWLGAAQEELIVLLTRER